MDFHTIAAQMFVVVGLTFLRPFLDNLSRKGFPQNFFELLGSLIMAPESLEGLRSKFKLRHSQWC